MILLLICSIILFPVNLKRIVTRGALLVKGDLRKFPLKGRINLTISKEHSRSVYEWINIKRGSIIVFEYDYD